MNKLLAALLILQSFGVWANDNAKTVIMLVEKNNRGVVFSKDIVIAGSDFLMVNAEKLTPAEIITQSPHIKKISTFPKVKDVSLLSCESGSFQHILKKGAQKKEETGCLNSERYKSLKKSFKALKKDPLTN